MPGRWLSVALSLEGVRVRPAARHCGACGSPLVKLTCTYGRRWGRPSIRIRQMVELTDIELDAVAGGSGNIAPF